MTRLFREGRTETVRSCTMESCAFVRSMIRDETVRLKSLIQSVNNTLEFFIMLPLLFSPPIRRKNVSGCWKRQQKSTKTCTAWRWRGKASTVTSSVCTWSPSTWEKILPSSRRYDEVPRCLFLTGVAIRTDVKTAQTMRFRSCLSLGGCPPVRLPSSSWSCLTWSNTRSTCLQAVVLVR